MSKNLQTRLTFLVAGTFFMELLDGTVIATALPQMSRTFHVTAVHMNIGITAYLLTLAIFIPISGWFSDRLGPRTTFASAIAIFTLASLLCGLSNSLPVFVMMRVLQGIGGAMMVPVGRLVVLRVTPKEKLTETMTFMQWPGLIALVLGPPVGGFITTFTNWRWIFFLNIPLGVIALVLALRWVESTREDEIHPFDWYTFVLGGAASTGLVYAMESLGAGNDNARLAYTVLALSFLCGIAAVLIAKRRPEVSLIDLVSMQRRSFAQGIYGAAAYRAAVSVLPFLLPLMFQLAFGLSAFRSGGYLLALFAGDLSMKFFVVRVLSRWGFRSTMIVDGLLAAGTLASIALLTPHTPVPLLLVMLFLHGACRSLQFTCINTLAYSEIPPAQMNRANSFLSTIQQLSTGLGVPLGAISVRLVARAHGDPIAMPALRDFHWAILVAAVFALGPVINSFFLAPDAGAAASGHRLHLELDTETV
ncbi:drug resistance transporter, EmrB/QacA subfamily [Bryocella elongata]|uniref:Drug resistance transporter, EmrB/QacA subfamily n=1 Tax=Bryocella elongata TaxID=863522 RepID=A0A1H5Y3R8_9BACT|nr:MFS transporter [Bryocella elongata]SEG18583.1 drug resistance transporter, EmrB/QacA subfamily [Bryocella elongata]